MEQFRDEAQLADCRPFAMRRNWLGFFYPDGQTQWLALSHQLHASVFLFTGFGTGSVTGMAPRIVAAVFRAGSLAVFSVAALVLISSTVTADEPDPTAVRRELLSEQQWTRLDVAIDKGLQYLASRQNPQDGSFAAPDLGQPGITGLCVLAFLSRGHVSLDGPHGANLERAIEFSLATQQENGLLFNLPIASQWEYGTAAHTGIYNHAIAGLMLGEVHGMTESKQSARISAAISAAVQFTVEHQRRRKRNPRQEGGWRYLRGSSGLRNDADMSISSWQLMFLRSARNNGFEVPLQTIDDGLGYVRRSFEPGIGAFTYDGAGVTRAMAASGVLSLSLAGEHQTPIAKAAGDWILKYPFDRYNRVERDSERYHYSAFYCSQAMFQLGGEHWSQFFPRFMQVLLENQRPDGSWPAESNRDGVFGSAYTTALMVLALTPPYQLLPIYQR